MVEDHKRLLITGASGFIGSHLVDFALAQGYEVYAGIRKTSSRAYLKDPKIHFIEIDIEYPERLEGSLKTVADKTGGFHFVIHNAGVTRPKRVEDFMKGNAEFTRIFAETLAKTQPDLQKFVFMSSLAAQGMGDHKSTVALSEDFPPNPISPYGKSKLAGEEYLRKIPKLNSVILRPTAVYGPRNTKFLLSLAKMMRKGFSIKVASKSQKLTFMHVSDLVNAVFLSLKSDLKEGTFNLSDGKATSIVEVNRLLKSSLQLNPLTINIPKPLSISTAYFIYYLNMVLKKPVFISHHKMREYTASNWQVDLTRAKTILGYNPEYDLKTGIEDTIMWFRAQKWL